MASKVRDYTKLATDILEAVGGETNLAGATHCATRLRLVLHEVPADAKEKISAMAGVITVVESGGQFQVVIGPHVGEVYDAFSALIDSSEVEEVEAPKMSIMNRIIATMSAVFAPFVYILVAAGIIQGILILITLVMPSFPKSGTYQVLSFISWSPFTFLPIFIAITASKHFKTNTLIAVACCAALVSPTWAEMAGTIANGTSINFMGIPLSQTVYTSSVLPPLFLVWILSYLERFLNKKVPEIIKELVVPLLCLLIMVPLTILIIGPLSSLGAEGIAKGYNYLVTVAPPLAGVIIGGFWQVLVIFGIHWGVTPMVMANFKMNGMDSFQAFQTIAVVAQVGAVLGVFIKSKNKELKNISLSAFITGLFGITEPAIYGVTLRFKKPFIFGCISGAVGALITSFFNSNYFAYAGLPSLLTIVNAISPKIPSSFIGMVIGCSVAIIGSVMLVQIFGTGETVSEVATMEAQLDDAPTKVAPVLSAPIINAPGVVNSPVTGKVIALTEVKDEVFASGAMGKGVAVDPTDNKIYAPFNGQIVMTTDTQHAIGLKADDGVEVLIHIGMDTVELKGKYFSTQVKDQDYVKMGDLLVEFDQDKIKAAGFSVVTPVIVTNSDDYEDVIAYTQNDIHHGEPIMELIPKGGK
ncbi:PTS beta-glucoside transporter subunit EIIBCA [Dellaglioa algida]|nr:PTS beta-glucoside transporter subunit EIIBCA [Dellaglioa algida]